MGVAGFNGAAQNADEAKDFMEDFARVRLLDIIPGLVPVPGVAAAQAAAAAIQPDWADQQALAQSGIPPDAVDAECVAGRKYLHIDVAAGSETARRAFLNTSGLSDKQRRDIYPRLSAPGTAPAMHLAHEVRRFNRHLDWLRDNNAPRDLFPTYHQTLGLHGRTQNTSGQVGAVGAAMAFLSAIETLDPNSIVGIVGNPPYVGPGRPPGPEEVLRWQRGQADTIIRSVLLRNGRALVFSSSKDANIFMNLGPPYQTAMDALRAYAAVRNDQALRHQRIHEFAVGEVKTATDPSNLHERMGLASRETQTELRTDRFLMMALLTPEILAGGVAGRVMNNQDLTRFSHVFNLHHCWGYDGGRDRNPDHWEYFAQQVRTWCGL